MPCVTDQDDKTGRIICTDYIFKAVMHRMAQLSILPPSLGQERIKALPACDPHKRTIMWMAASPRGLKRSPMRDFCHWTYHAGTAAGMHGASSITLEPVKAQTWLFGRWQAGSRGRWGTCEAECSHDKGTIDIYGESARLSASLKVFSSAQIGETERKQKIVEPDKVFRD